LRAFALLAALSLSACFDAEQRLRIYRDGSGELSAKLIFQPNAEGAGKVSALIRSLNRDVIVRERIENNRWTHEETASFRRLRDLQLTSEDITIETERTWTVGVSRARIKRVMFRPFGRDEGFGALSSGIFADKTYTFSFNLPGTVTKAFAVTAGKRLIEPRFRRSVASGTLVMWTIPMPALVDETELTFEAEFQGVFAMPELQSSSAGR
jgi:hypothetical protein